MKTYYWQDGMLYRPDGTALERCSWERAVDAIQYGNIIMGTNHQVVKRS